MKNNVIKNTTFDFALRIIKMYKFLTKIKKEYILSKQVLRSGTSIGASVSESKHAESKADFIHKMAIAQKEARETDYWIELLYQSDYFNKSTYISIKKDIVEINKILASIIISTKTNIMNL